ncbi:MAG: hypothetical protein ALECFALPRED_004921 [Alectoria fallacina]|uniref:NAD(P)-binding protein n=1 Tax=Alectoria fallacina TaxID=1903189 RepID=A0A8H3HZB3_9LECA|nr:MAG: hypothetical protein ALECFALPRED_004921 [Alectoria fallacina]
MGISLSQMFPPSAKFTEKEVPDQTGKVFLVTGGASGIGLELVQILYAHNAKIYVAARSEQKASKAIETVKTKYPKSQGELIFLHFDLDDLTLIKKSAEKFLSMETKLDVLWNNAGVMVPPQGTKTKQNYEAQLGTNCVGPFLFTKLVTPLLVETAKTAPTGSVRVVWVSSSAAGLTAPKGGVNMKNLDYNHDESIWYKYGASKAGNILHGTEYAKRYKAANVVSVPLDPGFLRTELQRHMTGLTSLIFYLISQTPIHGAYTELWAGLSPMVTPKNTGAFIIPWGRFGSLRKDIAASTKSKSEGGTGVGEQFWEWSEKQVQPYV